VGVTQAWYFVVRARARHSVGGVIPVGVTQAWY